MSWLSSGLKKVGHIAEKVAPFAGLIPGVGTLAGAAIGGLGALAAGDGLKGALKYGVEGGLSGLGGSKLLGGKGILGIGDGLKKVGGALAHPGDSLSSLSKSGIPGLVGQAGGIVNGIKNNVDPLLGSAALYAGYKKSGQADDYRKQAMDLAMQNWNDRSDLRKVGISGMLNETPPNLSSLFQANQSNPFSRRVA